eukprot:m.159771 g.159771  ORF g.159771 m.159771 type:complete len:174 (+) comp15159_c0_seq1:355-876(+)
METAFMKARLSGPGKEDKEKDKTLSVTINLNRENLEENVFSWEELTKTGSDKEEEESAEVAAAKALANKYVDVNDKYDSDDDFIDNSEAVSEPAKPVVTKHGSYFINTGKLEIIQPESSTTTSSKRKLSETKEDNNNSSSQLQSAARLDRASRRNRRAKVDSTTSEKEQSSSS